jgi:anti-sigma factor ChrR (cupin superfamily)
MSHVIDRLPELWLGDLPASECASIEAHLRECARCASEARAMSDVFEGLALTVAPIQPSPQIRARILTAAAAKGRLARFGEQLAKFFDVSIDKARALLDVVDDPASWEPGPVEGIALLHLSGGPRVAMADCGLVRFPAGMDWPLHRHVGPESMFIFEGGIVETDGTRTVAGQELHKPAGSEHAFKILPEQDCVCAVIVHEGIEMPPGTKLPF